MRSSCSVLAKRLALAAAIWIGFSAFANAEERTPISLRECAYKIVNPSPPREFELSFLLDLGSGAAADTEARAVLDYLGEKDFLCVRFASHEASLAKVADGRAFRVGKSCRQTDGLGAGRHDIVIRRDSHAIDVFIDGQRACTASESAPKGGGVGFGAINGRPSFDQVRFQDLGEIYFSDDFMREADAGGDWNPVSGRWALSHVRDVSRSANPFSCIGRGEERGLLITGHPFWYDYELSASAKCQDAGGFGLCFYYSSPKDYYLLRWNGKQAVPPERIQLVHVVDGGERVLAEKTALYRTDQWYRLSVTVDGETIEGRIDGNAVFAVHDDALRSGRAGLYVQKTDGALFDDVLIRSRRTAHEERRPIRIFSKVFETDEQMDNWASIWSSWEGGGPGGGRGRYWHKGTFFGDVSIEARLEEMPPSGGRVSFLVCGDGSGIDSGHRVEFDVGAKGSPRSVAIFSRGNRLASKDLEPGTLQVEYLGGGKQGGNIFAIIDGKTVLSAEGDAVDGKRIGCSSQEIDLSLRDAKVWSDDVYDYLFETAPVDWELELGEWKVTNRWICDPRWSWMSGRSDLLAAMWHKKEFRGDVVVEFFAGLQMREGREPYPHRGDINLTLCGDGKDLDSGYSFIYSGWGGRWTRILRKDKIVSGTDSYPVPGDLHRRWFHVMGAKIGDKVQLFIDGVLVRQFTDPDPLPGGRIAIWTYDNGLMLSRVRIYSGHVADLPIIVADKAEQLLSRDTESDHAPRPDRKGDWLRLDFESGIQGVSTRSGVQGALVEADSSTAAAGRRSLKLTNVRGGGDFGGLLPVAKYDPRKYPVIAFDYKIPPSVRVNLYLRIEDVMYEVAITGPSGECVGEVRRLARFSGIEADDRWRHAGIDLAPMLQSVLKRHDSPQVTEILLGNLSNKDYLLCGFGANRAGASYHIDSFAISAGHIPPTGK